MADSSIYRVTKLQGNSNYDIWALRVEALLIKEKCSEVMQIQPERLNNSNYSVEKLADLKEQEARALSILRLSLEDGPLLQTKEVKSPYTL